MSSAKGRHIAYHLSFAQTHRDEWEALSSKLGQIRRAWAACADSDEITLAFIEAMRLFQDRQALWQEELDWWESRGLEAVRRLGKRRDEAVLLNNIGASYRQLGNFGPAFEFYLQSLSIFREIDDVSGQAQVLNNVGAACYALNKIENAVEAYALASAFYESMGAHADSKAYASVLNNLGRANAELGKLDEALTQYEYALTLRQESNDLIGKAVTLNNIALVHEARSEYDQALDRYQQALDIDRALGNEAGIANTLRNIAGIYYLQGNMERATQLLHELLSYDERLHLPEEQLDRALLVSIIAGTT